jgi:hypothetical protein
MQQGSHISAAACFSPSNGRFYSVQTCAVAVDLLPLQQITVHGLEWKVVKW